MPPAKREMTTLEAVKLTPGMSVANLQKWLRDAYLMKAQPCPFGHAVLGEGGKWCYYIYPKRMDAYINGADICVHVQSQNF